MRMQEIKEQLKKMQNGGRIFLPTGEYPIDETIVFDTPCVKLEGEVWNYSSDPNGVFESKYGTKLRMKRNDIPAIMMTKDHVLGGNVIRDIGIQGNIAGMDTRHSFDYENPAASAGIYFDNQRIDQAEFSKISFCGLGSAVCAAGDAEIDGCTFEKLNADGCCIGVYFAPGASYYPMFRSCIFADNPFYGFFLNGEGRHIHNVDLNDARFVRNGGAFPKEHPYPAAAVCFWQASNCHIRNCIFDYAGVYWHYDADAVENNERQIQKQKTPALLIEGNKNHVTGNSFSHSTAESIVIRGDGNILMNNIVDGDVVISGQGNVVAGIVFTKEDAKLILTQSARDTRFVNVDEDRIQYA